MTFKNDINYTKKNWITNLTNGNLINTTKCLHEIVCVIQPENNKVWADVKPAKLNIKYIKQWVVPTAS